MSQKESDSKSGNRSRTISCQGIDNRNAEQVFSFGTPLDELRKELEKELQNSKRVLAEVIFYRGNTSKGSRGQSQDKMNCSGTQRAEKSCRRAHQRGSSDTFNVKKTSLRDSLPNQGGNMHSSNEQEHGIHKLEITKFSQYERSHHQHQHQHQHQHHGHHHESRSELPKLDGKSIKSITHLSKLRKTPSHIICELDDDLEFLGTSTSKTKEGKRIAGNVIKLPEVPCLPKEQIAQMIECETQDVESAWYLSSEERRTYKKPCPKQQKAQMGIKALFQAARDSSHTCGKKYSTPLELPEPEDISPEMAAAMMFMQEQGIKMEECPAKTVTYLFPDDPRPALPEKGSVSVVDSSQDDQKGMIEKSASVPSEGVSDSAYTRRMRSRGDDFGPQRSYDVDYVIGQTNREYVYVAQKPQRVNMVRFRGGSTPSWFPWYLSAFPDDQEGLKLANSPSGLFYKAWLYSNPENIQNNDVIVLD